MQSKSMIIKLFYGPIKFKSTLVKLYFINSIFIENQQLVLNNPVPKQETTSAKTSQTKIFLANILLTEALVVTTPLILSTSLFLIK